ncbi:concanavalin A-like lectin/glucanase domain-containing protein [Umbelopsis sp. AD052]|nr:concanavalin A-like lectin/glucanase domain-containing protein [Umbelopsis sp. AD052]
MRNSLLIVSLSLLWWKTTADNLYQGCDCGFVNENGLFTNYWISDFSNYSNDIHRDKEFYVANYTIEAKYPGTFPRSFDPKNVNVINNALQLAVTIGDDPQCGAIGTKRQDLFYGSFRAYIKTTGVPGTVSAFFLYGNDSEIDMETLSALNPPETYFAIHPGLTDAQSGRASALTHTNYMLNYTPSEEYHEYRFDWIPGLAIFYVDGKEANRLYTNIPTVPGRILVNHWTDGNANFSQGPPKQNAFMEVQNITLFFNVSTSTNSSANNMACQSSHQACSIDVTTAESMPTPTPSVSQSGAVSLQSSLALLSLPATLVAAILCPYFL